VANFGTEAGVYLRFIVDHYDNLPNITVFVHGRPEHENTQWEQWMKCLRRNISYVSLCPTFVQQRTPLSLAHQHDRAHLVLWNEQCWRDLADIFRIRDRWARSKEPVVHTFARQTFAMSATYIRRIPLDVYQRAYEVVVRPTCHLGAFDGDLFYRARSDIEGLDLGQEREDTR
jgi:hypothetical protein